MQIKSKCKEIENSIFSIKTREDFLSIEKLLFEIHCKHNRVYAQYVEKLTAYGKIKEGEIAYLPIDFFKREKILLDFCSQEGVFMSSGTGAVNARSKHYIHSFELYEKSCIEAFRYFLGEPKDYCFLALLPSYLEQGNSSLIHMVRALMQKSDCEYNNFYLNDLQKLYENICLLEKMGKKTLLIGVSYALLDFLTFVESQSLPPLRLKNTLIMETGGMKGRKKEILREELHAILKKGFGVSRILSEYGMCELFSQAYLMENSRFRTPNWMQIRLNAMDDPLRMLCGVGGGEAGADAVRNLGGGGGSSELDGGSHENSATGQINVCDLANIYSCPFIKTQDIGRLYADGSFEVLGRLDYSELRGCNLMVV